MFQLSVCEGTFFRDLPFEQRVREISRAGFSVELWGWEEQSLDTIAADSKIRIASIPGWVAGSMVHPDGVTDFLRGVKKNLRVAERLGCKNVAMATGELDRQGQVIHAIAEHPADVWITAYRTLSELAELAEKHDIFYNFEVLNTKVDHARYPFPKLQDGARLVRQVGSPRLRLLLDVYHVQVEEGNLIQGIRDSRDLIGHVHVADVPGRHEPGTGEIHYPRVVAALREIGFSGTIGLEAFPESDDHVALERFRRLFSEDRP